MMPLGGGAPFQGTCNSDVRRDVIVVRVMRISSVGGFHQK
jgi:hypothetical protein